jgi:hypothetical protein
MKYSVEIDSGAMIQAYIPSFIKTGSGIQKLIGMDTRNPEKQRVNEVPELSG